MVTSYYRELINYFSKMLGSRDDAADLVQETYARVLSAERKDGPLEEPRAFLYQTAKNLLVDQHRRSQVRGLVDDEGLDELPVSASAQPEEVYAATQRMERIVRVIDNLPRRCREAFLLHKFEGMSHAEVAAHMGISRNMVERHVMLAMMACRKSRESDGEPVPDRGAAGHR